LGELGPNLVLIGLRGSGKSTLGARVAERLGCDFVDLDHVTARVLGCNGAGEAIAQHGMDAFRGAERTALDSELGQLGRVIALGGGTPTADGCAELLREGQSLDRCRVVYLRGGVETLRERLALGENADRPSLTGGDVVDEVQEVFEARDPLYREIAGSVLHIDGVELESCVVALCSLALSSH
tara:strand:+ start:3197 stop:3745 length:549 start_codon:yes stop_codon:yes gene_type:complete